MKLCFSFLIFFAVNSFAKDWSKITKIEGGFIVTYPYWPNSVAQVYRKATNHEGKHWDIVCEKIGNAFLEKFSFKKIGSACDGYKTQFRFRAFNPEYVEHASNGGEIFVPSCSKERNFTSNFILKKLTCRLVSVK